MVGIWVHPHFWCCGVEVHRTGEQQEGQHAIHDHAGEVDLVEDAGEVLIEVLAREGDVGED